MGRFRVVIECWGMIARTVNDVADGTVPFKYAESPFEKSVYNGSNSHQAVSSLFSVTGEGVDGQQDFFYLRCGKYTARFVWDFINDCKPILFPKQDLEIIMDNGGCTEVPNTIQVKTPEGLLYVFGNQEVTVNTVVQCNTSSKGHAPIVNNWLLSRVESLATGHFMDFTYDQEYLEYTTRGSETNYNNNYVSDDRCTIKNQINSLKLSSISTSQGRFVIFSRSKNSRCDLSDGHFLSTITVNNVVNENVKKFQLDYHYMDRNGNLTAAGGNCSAYDSNDPKIRLMLTSVQESGYDMENDQYTDTRPPYRFEYNREKGLPNRLTSNAQDYWGYYNGKHSNTSLVPATVHAGEYYDGANRLSYFDFAKQGTLSKIFHPLGGFTTYEYGLNETDDTFTGPLYLTNSPNIGTGDANGKVVDFELKTERRIALNFSASGVFATRCVEPEISLAFYELNNDNTIKSILYNTDDKVCDNLNTSSLQHYEEKKLSAGRYRLKQILREGYDDLQLDDYRIMVEVYDLLTQNYAGGLRIEKVQTFDPYTDITPMTKHFTYKGGKINCKMEFGRWHRYSYVGNGESYMSSWAITSGSIAPLHHTSQRVVGYEEVTIQENTSNSVNGLRVTEFYTVKDNPDRIIPVMHGIDYIGKDPKGNIRVFPNSTSSVYHDSEDTWEYPYGLLDSKHWKRGIPKSESRFNSDGNLVSKTDYQYAFYDDRNSGHYDPAKVNRVYGVKADGYLKTNTVYPEVILSAAFHELESSYYKLIGTEETTYDGDESVTVKTNYTYDDDHYQLISTSQERSDGKTVETIRDYATSFYTGELGSDLLKNNHMHSQVLRQRRMVDDELVSKVEVQYHDPYGEVVPVKSTRYSTGDNSNPKEVFYSHDSYGNVTGVMPKDGMPTAYVWGYNGTLLVAKIENATHYDVDSVVSMLNRIPNITDVGEMKLRLSTLRSQVSGALSDARVTTYLHEPGYGMISLTDPNGQVTTYEYDPSGRLVKVIDEDGYILSQNKYHYGN